MDLLLHSIAAKYNAKFFPASRVVELAASDEYDYQIDFPDPDNNTAYLFLINGYTQGENINVTLFNSSGNKIHEWGEFIDTAIKIEIIPFLEQSYNKYVTFKFTNSDSVAQTIGWDTQWIIVPDTNNTAFKNAIKEVADLLPLLAKIEARVSAVYQMPDQKDAAFQEVRKPILNIPNDHG